MGAMQSLGGILPRAMARVIKSRLKLELECSSGIRTRRKASW
jgi:hypothetical protein